MLLASRLHLSHLRYRAHELYACAILMLGVIIRLILISQGWPQTDSDEGIIGLMSLHIAYHGEHPIFFYGQGFMGSLDATARSE